MRGYFMTSEISDPIPEKFSTLPEVLERLTAITTDLHIETARRDFVRRREMLGAPLPEAQPDENSFPDQKAISEWQRRELAIQNLRLALLEGALSAFARDPASGEMFRFEPADWVGAAF